MRRTILLASVLVCSFCLIMPAMAFRCGERANKIATEGMHKYQILADCGEPTSRDLVGYEKSRIIEEWLYIIDDGVNRQMYLIRFNPDGYAVKVEWLGKQD